VAGVDWGVVCEAGSAAGAEDHGVALGGADDLESTPAAAGAADAAAPSGAFYLGQVFGIHRGFTFTIVRRAGSRHRSRATRTRFAYLTGPELVLKSMTNLADTYAVAGEV